MCHDADGLAEFQRSLWHDEQSLGCDALARWLLGRSAVALATGMSALEIGSDIGASIRNPAHYCGVYGHKPTYGVVPYRGHLLAR